MSLADSILAVLMQKSFQFNIMFFYIVMNFFIFPLAFLVIKKKRAIYENIILAIPFGIYFFIFKFITLLIFPKNALDRLFSILMLVVIPGIEVFFLLKYFSSDDVLYSLILYYLTGVFYYWAYEFRGSFNKLFD